jgi:phage baseplate assembly protein W
MISPKIVDGDIVIDENGDIVMVEDDEELAQSVRSILETRKGEFFLEPNHGVSFDNLLGKQANQHEARDDIIEAVSQEARVAAVTEVVITDDRKTRKRSVNVTVQKEDGTQVEVGEVNIGGA